MRLVNPEDYFANFFEINSKYLMSIKSKLGYYKANRSIKTSEKLFEEVESQVERNRLILKENSQTYPPHIASGDH